MFFRHNGEEKMFFGIKAKNRPLYDGFENLKNAQFQFVSEKHTHS